MDAAPFLRHSCPRWIVRLLREDLGDVAAERFLVAANMAPERCLRVNTLRAGVADAIEALAGDGLATSAMPGLREALLFSGPALERSAPFREGLVTPQSRGSQLVGHVVAEGLAGGVEGRAPLVLDLCAAPGTKTSQLVASLPGARVTALDLDAARLAALRENMARLGVRGIEVVQGDVLFLPCGLSGRLRRRAPRRSVQRSWDAVVALRPALAAARRRRAAAGRSAAPHDGASGALRASGRYADLRGLHPVQGRDGGCRDDAAGRWGVVTGRSRRRAGKHGAPGSWRRSPLPLGVRAPFLPPCPSPPPSAACRAGRLLLVLPQRFAGIERVLRLSSPPRDHPRGLGRHGPAGVDDGGTRRRAGGSRRRGRIIVA